MVPQMLRKIRRGSPQRRRSRSGECEQLPWPRTARRRSLWSFLYDDVAIRPARTQSRDPRPPWLRALPLPQSRIHVERAAREIDLRIWRFEIDARWKLLVGQRI